MNFRLRFGITAGLLAGVLYGCAPTRTVSTYSLEPASGEIAMIDGRNVTKTEQNGIGVVASFEREELDFIALDVEIKNNTDHPIEVNPADFRLVALGAQQDTLPDPKTQTLPYARMAANPGYELSHVARLQAQEAKRLKRAKILNTVLMVALVASDMASNSRSRSYGEYVSNRVSHDVGYQALAVKRMVDHSSFANRMQQYDYEAYRWRELAMKATTLPAGQSVRGLVYLPKMPTARYVAITYSLPEQAAIPLVFSQQEVKQRITKRKSY